MKKFYKKNFIGNYLLFFFVFSFFSYFAFAKNSKESVKQKLTLEERFNFQKAIEEIYWNERIWPKENLNPKPSLESIISDVVIKAKVEDYLRKSNALEYYWQRPISGEQLQAEMDRIANNTKNPAVLKEIFKKLNKDPYVIAECLARPILSDRLIRNWYAFDEKFNSEIKRKAEEDLLKYNDVEKMNLMSGHYSEIEYFLSDEEGMQMDILNKNKNQIILKKEEWIKLKSKLKKIVNKEIGKISKLQENENFFYVIAILKEGSDSIKLAKVKWKKPSFEKWWKGERLNHNSSISEYNFDYTLPIIRVKTCANDIWKETFNAASERYGHTAVWTGTEMIIWGGNEGSLSNTGGRYNPGTDSWISMSTTNAPSARSGHTAVWTGSEMIIWGGWDGNPSNTGGRYNPNSDSWIQTSTTNAPSGRTGHTAVWTGSEMIIWGGYGYNVSGFYFNTGGKYNPSTDSWTETSTTNAPSARSGHTAVWTGSEMIIWGGWDGNPSNTGGRYDPNSDSWIPTSTINAPSGRTGHTAVWTGSEMIIWGGNGNTGGKYNPNSDSWIPITTTNAPLARSEHTAVWTGSEMIVWGGKNLNTGGRYNPSTDSWTATSTTNAPSGRAGHTAVWTGSEMIIWGGYGCNVSGFYFNTGGKYNPSTDSWTETSTTNAPSGRTGHTAVWTGSEMIIWGGSGDFYGLLDVGGKYNPTTDSWTATSTENAPFPRVGHTAVWTGSEMIIWGGYFANTGINYFYTGGRYNPITDSWTETSTADAPSARSGHTAVWTGSEMIIWGGYMSINYLNTGGKYNPITDSWTETSTANAPSARSGHTAVWTGSEMIVWGGKNLNTGGRYNPSTDSWTATSTTNAPSGRTRHTAVWTGTEMMIWGGDEGSLSNTGGRYNPGTDSWISMSTTNAPSARSGHTAVWTGSEMIIWGGRDGNPSNTGGRYNPNSDSWIQTSTINAPSGRAGHTAVWTGSEMIIWGGYDGNSLNSGGIYSVGCILVRIF